MYYLRTKPAAAAIQFTVDKTKLKSAADNKKSKADEEGDSANGKDVDKLEKNMAAMMCSLQNKDDCLMCGS